ncbi:hypothetical protein [Novosphingobium resinovorum]|uniref:Uncharacterized protein n=2 Tax=Sphingomonadaceae TaxID=41297 RepID=A0A031JPG0_9SPHN|nr:hypothetical protein [Novosphingobium resinovorum]AOR79268.1 hypothetical protein BES08_20620 [Novosphingobium resinovorum]EZP79671.1 hypothetical protein BV97_03828 [Novosphingobium resinovorum]
MMTTGSQSAGDLLRTAHRLLEDEQAFTAAAMVCGAIDLLEGGLSRPIVMRSAARRFGHAPVRSSAYRSCA